MSINLPVDGFDYSYALACPDCGEDNLHHGAVEIFNRVEDEEEGAHVIVDGNNIFRNDRLDGNPSHRRSGIKIYFFCEYCHGVKILEIAQHKGKTLLAFNSENLCSGVGNVQDI